MPGEGLVVHIVRHGERIDQVDGGAWMSSKPARALDPPLSARGELQALELAKRLKDSGIQEIYSSPFYRVIQTVAPLAAALNIKIKIERGLSEWLPEHDPHYAEERKRTGSDQPRIWLDETPREEALRRFPQLDFEYESAFRAVYPEAKEACFQRCGAAARRLVEERVRGAGRRALLAVHAAGMQAVVQHLAGPAVHVHTPYCGLSRLALPPEPQALLVPELLACDEHCRELYGRISFEGAPLGEGQDESHHRARSIWP
eukprot:tig00000507_g1780.t1